MTPPADISPDPDVELITKGGADEGSSDQFVARFPATSRRAIEAHMALSQAFITINQAMSRYLAPQGFALIRAQHNLLTVLFVSDDNQLALGDIAKAMGVTAPYVTKLLDSFEVEGLVERVSSQLDRRVIYARLTPVGKERCATIVPGFVAFIEEVGRVLSSEEKLELTRLLRKYSSGVSQLDELPSPK